MTFNTAASGRIASHHDHCNARLRHLVFSRLEPFQALDGFEIFVGTNNGKVFRLDAPDWSPNNLSIPGNTQAISRFSVAKTLPQFATTSTRIFRLDSSGWTDVTPTTPAPIGELTALTSDHDSPKRQLFLSSSSQVWSSQDHGLSWFDFGGGILPKQPQITDLRFVTEFSGASFLYLSTWGWSVFRTLLNFDEVLKTVTVSGHMDIVDRVAIGHDIWAHPSIFLIPPAPV